MLSAVTWHDEGIHKLIPRYASNIMSKATMWNSRQRYLPKLVYSVSVLLLKSIMVWRNVLGWPSYINVKFLCDCFCDIIANIFAMIPEVPVSTLGYTLVIILEKSGLEQGPLSLLRTIR